MVFNKVMLLGSSKNYELEIRPKVISLFIVFSGFTYIVIAFIIATLRVDVYQKDMEIEIQDLRQQKYALELRDKALVQRYNDLVEPEMHKDYMQKAIVLVNPYLDSDCVKWWSNLIYEGQFSIKENLNRWTLEKINSKYSSLHIPPGAALILAVAALENGFDILGSSNKGAVGAFQLHPTLTSGLEMKNPSHPQENVLAGISYLSYLLNQFKEYPDQLEFALAAYNAGPTRVGEEWMSQWGSSWTTISAELRNSQKTYVETRNYVVMGTYLAKIFTSGEWKSKSQDFWHNYRERILQEAKPSQLLLSKFEPFQ